jgi:hypothetical protein
MRRNELSRKARNNTWRIRAVTLALAGTGLITAIASAEIGGKPGLLNDAAMTRTITRQRIAEGQLPLAGTGAGKPAPTMTREQILASAASYESEMTESIAHAEKLRLDAYHSKDIIRMNFISGKLDEMRQILAVAQPALVAIREPGQEMFVMLAKLSTIRQGAERVKHSMDEVEAALGDTADPTMALFGAVNSTNNDSNGTTDPTGVPAPTFTVDRPVPASPFR